MDAMRRHRRGAGAAGGRRAAVRPRRRTGLALGTALALAVFGVLTPGCGVPRPAPQSAVDLDFATVPNLRRAREALEDRIALEREHVAALETQLAGLRKEEERSYSVFLEAEQEYQLLQSDLGGTQQDLAEAESELAALRGRVESTRQRVALMHDELRRLLDDLARLHGLHQEILALTERLGAAPVSAASEPAAPDVEDEDEDEDAEGEGEGEEGAADEEGADAEDDEDPEQSALRA